MSISEHGNGSWGVRATWTNKKQTVYWSMTEVDREADYKMLKNKPEIYTVTRVRR